MTGDVKRAVFAGFLAAGLCGSVLAQTAANQGDPANAAGSATTATADAATQGSHGHDDTFVIGNDDVLAIDVWKEPEFTQKLPVRSDGKISLPLIGDVQASGETPKQLEQEIRTKLQAYIEDPNVTVLVAQINSQKFNILGRVFKPGSYPMSMASTVLDAIAAAGGFQDFAKQKDIYVLRPNKNGAETRIPFNYKDVIRGKHPEENIKLEPHDTIVVP